MFVNRARAISVKPTEKAIHVISECTFLLLLLRVLRDVVVGRCHFVEWTQQLFIFSQDTTDRQRLLLTGTSVCKKKNGHTVVSRQRDDRSPNGDEYG